MSPPKNNLRLAELAGGLLARQQDGYMVFVGRENETIKAAMIDRLRMAGVVDRVRFAGERNDVPRVMKSADLFLFPSLWEGLPGTVLEACAAGTPVLASRIPGTRELADRFPLVHTLPLAASDDEWIRLAGTLLAQPPTAGHRRQARLFFQSTPYDIGRCADAHVRAWEDSAVGSFAAARRASSS
jgi:glycosyltransferase involved in cell wall biosynthesis